jgi:hypothetical protein
MTLINQNDIHDEIMSRLNSGNAYYHSVQNLLCTHLLSKNLEINYTELILLVVLYGCKTWSLREEHTLRVLRRVFGPKREEDIVEKLHDDEFHSLYSSPNIVRVGKSKRMRWVGQVTHMG